MHHLDLRLHVNHGRGACVLARADDGRPVSSDQWWRYGLTETEALRLLWAPEADRRAYLRATWPWPPPAPARPPKGRRRGRPAT